MAAAKSSELCRACPLYGQCVRDRRRRGRFVTLHCEEELLQTARALQRTEYFREQYRQRVAVEHRIARLVQLGIRQSRYLGKGKTLLQVVMAATVANLTLLTGQLAKGPTLSTQGDGGGGLPPFLLPLLAGLGAIGAALMRLLRPLGQFQPLGPPRHSMPLRLSTSSYHLSLTPPFRPDL